MSWGEVKKINSNLLKPLNTLITEKHADLANKFGLQYVNTYTNNSSWEKSSFSHDTNYFNKSGILTISNAPSGIAIFSPFAERFTTSQIPKELFRAFVRRNNNIIITKKSPAIPMATSGTIYYGTCFDSMIVPLTRGDAYEFIVDGIGLGIDYPAELHSIITIFSWGGGIS